MTNRIITYSLLAHINNKTNAQSNFDQIFLPLVKRGLSKMCASGQYKGDDINDIQKHIDELYGLNMPNSVLKVLLAKIENELNTHDKVVLKFYTEGSFIISQYIFDELEEEIATINKDLEKLQHVYMEFIKAEGKEASSESVFDFIEQNKKSIGRYIGKKSPLNVNENNIQARFVQFIQPIGQLNKALQSVYIGSIISTYLEYQPNNIKSEVELVLDTNFIISLIDLNTPASTKNCQRLLTIAERIGYKFTVLAITIREIDQLLKTRVDNFDTAFLSKILDQEDIYNACERRGLTKTDLDRIRGTIVDKLGELKVNLISNTEKYENRARFSETYEKLKLKRNTTFAALHDAACIEYVTEKRGRILYEFGKVNCWFINNSSSRGTYYTSNGQPHQIRAEDLLNLLWLTSPMVKASIPSEEMAFIGLSRLVSTTLDNSLPSALSIKELDDNIQKYGRDNLTDEDVVYVSRGIAERTISDLYELNELARHDKIEFVEKLQSIATLQKQKEANSKEMLNRVMDTFNNKIKEFQKKENELDMYRQGFENSIIKEQNERREAVELNSELLEQNRRYKIENINLLNQQRKKNRDKYLRKKVRMWRGKAFLWVMLCIVSLFAILIYVYYLNGRNVKLSKEFIDNYLGNILVSGVLFVANIVFSGFIIKLLSDRFNQSAVNAYKANIDIPEDMQELRYRE